MELYGELKVAETVNIQNNSGNDNITDNNVINNNDKKKHDNGYKETQTYFSLFCYFYFL